MASKTTKTRPTRKAGPRGKNGARNNGTRKNGARNHRARSAAAAPSHLAQEIVIESASVDAQIGAQAIAPDHVARSASIQTIVPQIARPASLPVTDDLREIEQFLYRQSELLD